VLKASLSVSLISLRTLLGVASPEQQADPVLTHIPLRLRSVIRSEAFTPSIVIFKLFGNLSSNKEPFKYIANLLHLIRICLYDYLNYKLLEHFLFHFAYFQIGVLHESEELTLFHF
jgi:hypothetical protein